MAARKLQQEVDKCFKKVAEGVAEFDSIYEKIEQSNNPSQKEKLEDTLKREIKKLQRLRDQIKTWAAGNDIKDKGPLMDQRRLIETQMERFKAVEKAMKTKAYSKEGLSAAAKMDPKEEAKDKASIFLSDQVEALEQQIEALEAKSEGIQATMKKGKSSGAKADRMAEIDSDIERHKWHQGKLELMRRALENGKIETEQVNDLEESITYYVTENQSSDFMEDDSMYDDLNLDEDDYGLGQDNDRVSSQDTQSVQDEVDPESRPASIPVAKARAADPTGPAGAGRRPSAQLKSPLPSLATLHQPISSNGAQSNASMKPASIPQRPAEGLKYASAAAAAAAADKIGIAPLPPPPGAAPVSVAGPSSQVQARASAANSPSPAPIQPVAAAAPPAAEKPAATPAPSKSAKSENAKSSKAAGKAPAQPASVPEPAESSKAPRVNGSTNGVKAAPIIEEDSEEESIFHLPASLQDLVESFDMYKKRPMAPSSALTQHMLAQSQKTAPDVNDSEAPRTYHPESRYVTQSNYPHEPLPILEDPRLYGRVDSDTLFYVFYYKQGSYQQYLAAKALKDMSWRFHKQYQTWFQRHEEPKSITEEFEQGTYRFFDYESTWMNRRKADFKFAYKFLEDDV